MVIEAPVPTEAPLPQPPSYHTQLAPVPKEPPFAVSVTLPGLHTCPYKALLVALVAATEGVCTLTLNEQEEELQELVAVQVTDVVPVANVLPEAGVHVTTAAGLPVDEGVAKVTTGLQVVMSAGQAPITGLSLMVTVNEHASLPQEFVAVHVTVVVPVTNVEPEAGEQVTEGAGAPVAVGVEKVAI